RQRPLHSHSGAQTPRRAIAGARASRARLLLLDEPTALLDDTSQREVLTLIRDLCSRAADPICALWITHRPEAPLTALGITHRLEELERCDGAALMEHGAVGRWQNGPSLAALLAPLQGGGPEG
ncbi:MAG: hypothetical protein ACKOHJ_09560, partial [Vulcanococcus sp.]